METSLTIHGLTLHEWQSFAFRPPYTWLIGMNNEGFYVKPIYLNPDGKHVPFMDSRMKTVQEELDVDPSWPNEQLGWGSFMTICEDLLIAEQVPPSIIDMMLEE